VSRERERLSGKKEEEAQNREDVANSKNVEGAQQCMFAKIHVR
jgi:hypothetical protein